MDQRDAPGPRYEPRVRDGVLFVEMDDGSIEIGPLDDVVESIGGETYTVEYDSVPADAIDWLDTDDQRLEIDVRDTVTSFAYTDEFVRAMADVPRADEAEDGRRVEVFADMVTAIWDAKGNMDGAARE